MRTGLIILISISLLGSIIMLFCTLKVIKMVKEQFRCSKCTKINKKITGKCEYCKHKLDTGYVYKSTFFGRRDCKDEQGNFDLDKTLKHIKQEVIIWVIICLTASLALILAYKLL